MDREDVVHIYSGILHSHEKEQDAICHSVDGARDDRTKGSPSDRERQIPRDAAHTWNPKCDTNELVHKAEIASQMQDTKTATERGKRGGRNEETGTDTDPLLETTLILEKSPLYSTRNSTQYSVRAC